MLQIVIFIIVILAGFFTRKMWGNFLVKTFKKGTARGSQNNDIIPAYLGVFPPKGTTRNFAVSLDIIEQGDGTVSFNIAKIKAKDII